MKKILVIKAFRDKNTGDVRTPNKEYDYEDERAEELVAGGWAKFVKEPEIIKSPEPVEEKTKGTKTKKKKK